MTWNDISSGGDSGGPWFDGGIAQGIHAGAIDDEHSFFTRISRVGSLDAYVVQGG
ncbi:S1 family peptidase [Nocardioides sp. B-3]|uniref:S1 family peptidase n=1 Tax=Nocardioides sp. B-3 TaxID=2895565 RepID=UPI00215269DE|nr:S1 family peptidase [Nocardioides sp. B-3]UUZ59902.1 S1 family peptidase [Nocardioides sp. B-3]